MDEEEILQGGVANAGSVVRVGAEVLRPSNPSSQMIHAMLRYVRQRGFYGAPNPVAIEDEGRERLKFIPGEVAVLPFPDWVQTEEVLTSTARLLCEFHDATVGFVPLDGVSWNRELADPGGGGAVICHNDVCVENVVFKDGSARALLDFDFAAPGRRAWDVAHFARYFVPMETDQDAALTGRGGLDPFQRLRVLAEGYGPLFDGGELVDAIGDQIANGAAFVLRRVEAGEVAFVEMLEQLGGVDRYTRRQEWFDANRVKFLHALPKC